VTLFVRTSTSAWTSDSCVCNPTLMSIKELKGDEWASKSTATAIVCRSIVFSDVVNVTVTKLKRAVGVTFLLFR